MNQAEWLLRKSFWQMLQSCPFAVHSLAVKKQQIKTKTSAEFKEKTSSQAFRVLRCNVMSKMTKKLTIRYDFLTQISQPAAGVR
jgi:hypothetical protein